MIPVWTPIYIYTGISHTCITYLELWVPILIKWSKPRWRKQIIDLGICITRIDMYIIIIIYHKITEYSQQVVHEYRSSATSPYPIHYDIPCIHGVSN